MNDQWLEFAVRIQSIAQAGLQYGRDKYDLERYGELRDIAAEMIAAKTDIPLAKVRDLFCNETGYQAPKLDTRAAVFLDGKILLVHENNGTWSLPGGWCDVNESIASNTEKEVREEPASRYRRSGCWRCRTGESITSQTMPTGLSNASSCADMRVARSPKTSKRRKSDSSGNRSCRSVLPAKNAPGHRLKCASGCRRTRRFRHCLTDGMKKREQPSIGLLPRLSIDYFFFRKENSPFFS